MLCQSMQTATSPFAPIWPPGTQAQDLPFQTSAPDKDVVQSRTATAPLAAKAMATHAPASITEVCRPTNNQALHTVIPASHSTAKTSACRRIRQTCQWTAGAWCICLVRRSHSGNGHVLHVPASSAGTPGFRWFRRNRSCSSPLHQSSYRAQCWRNSPGRTLDPD
jgi:hypothetical protein